MRAKWRRKRAQMRGERPPPLRGPDVELDEIAIEVAAAGKPVDLTIPERREVVRLLTSRGLSAREIAKRLRLSQRQVVRHRAALGRAA